MKQLLNPIQSTSSAPPYRKWVVIGSIITALVALACISTWVVSGIQFFQRSQRDADTALQIVRQFIQAGTRDDSPAGIALFDSSTNVTEADIARLFTERRSVFVGVNDVQQDGFTIYHGTNGTTAAVQGTISYTNQPSKRFSAQLRQVNGIWRITRIDVTDRLGE